MMNADQLRARADFYREKALLAEEDRDFALNLVLAGMFDTIARDVRRLEETRGREPRRHRDFLDQLSRFMPLKNRLPTIKCDR
jgi:hypothetical protein